jgi:hypothetical protein
MMSFVPIGKADSTQQKRHSFAMLKMRILKALKPPQLTYSASRKKCMAGYALEMNRGL